MTRAFASRRIAPLAVLLTACMLPLAGGCEKPRQTPTTQPAATQPTETTTAPATAPATTQAADGTIHLFNGRNLTGWKVLREVYFDRAGKVEVKNGEMILGAGNAMTGVRWAGEFPKDDYEVVVEARRLDGEDFFCGLTFPVSGGHVTLICGGWGGMVVGLSNIDGMAADENETTQGIEFEMKRWYTIRVRVTEGHIDIWLDGKRIIETETEGHEFTVWPQQEDARPFGITTWHTKGGYRKVTLRRLK